jgi:hypothetical protein
MGAGACAPGSGFPDSCGGTNRVCVCEGSGLDDSNASVSSQNVLLIPNRNK